MLSLTVTPAPGTAPGLSQPLAGVCPWQEGTPGPNPVRASNWILGPHLSIAFICSVLQGQKANEGGPGVYETCKGSILVVLRV
jgi:hypothetical protein